VTTHMEVRGKHRAVFLVTYRAALVLVLGVLGAFLLGGWRLQVVNDASLHREHVAQLEALQREKALSAAANAAANRARCEAGNDFRVADLKRWLPLIYAAERMPPNSPTARATVNAFVTNTITADKLIDCSKV
jgi:hypothetical protein